MNKQLHEQRDAAKHADIDRAQSLDPDAPRNAGGAHGGADQKSEDNAGERNGHRRRRRLGEIVERVEDDLRLHRAVPEGQVVDPASGVSDPALYIVGGQIDGSGTVFGKSIVWPNQVFWIFAIVPSASTLRIAALIASISALSSRRATHEK